MAKNGNKANSNKNLDLDNIKVGMTIPDSTKNPQNWKIDNDLIEQMRRYEKESGKSAIYRNKLTGMFLYFKYCEEHPEYLIKKNKVKSKKNKKEVDIEKLQKQDVKIDEDLLKDAIEDYKSEYNVKRVNPNSQKFKRYFYQWKKSN